MLLSMDNKEAEDLVRQIMHIHVKQCLLWELKGDCLLQIEHVTWDENNEELFTKNLLGSTVKKHMQIYCRTDKYGKQGKVLKVMWDLPNPQTW